MYSKSTENLGLPQWEPKDHPDFLTDMNQAYATIDKHVSDNTHNHQDLQEQVNALAVDMTTVQDEVRELKEKVDNLVNLEDNPVFIELKERVDTLEGDLTALDSRVVKNADDIETIKNTCESIDRELRQIQEHLENHDTEFTMHDKEIRDIKLEIQHIHNDVDDLRSHVAECESKVARMETEVGHIKAEQITQNDDIQTLKDKTAKTASDLLETDTKVSFNTDRIAGLEESTELLVERTDALESRIGTVEDRATSIESDVTALGGRVDTTESDISALKPLGSTVESMQTTLNEISDKIDSGEIGEGDGGAALIKATEALNTANAAKSDSATALENSSNAVNTANAASGAANTAFNATEALSVRVREVERKINHSISGNAVLDSRVNSLENKEIANRNDINTLIDRVDEQEEKDVELENHLNSHDSSISALEVTTGNQSTSISAIEATNATQTEEISALGMRVEALEDGQASVNDINSIISKFSHNTITSFSLTDSSGNCTMSVAIIRIEGLNLFFLKINDISLTGGSPLRRRYRFAGSTIKAHIDELLGRKTTISGTSGSGVYFNINESTEVIGDWNMLIGCRTTYNLANIDLYMYALNSNFTTISISGTMISPILIDIR